MICGLGRIYDGLEEKQGRVYRTVLQSLNRQGLKFRAFLLQKLNLNHLYFLIAWKWGEGKGEDIIAL